MKLLALTIGQPGQPNYGITPPSQIVHIVNLGLPGIISFAISLVLFAAILLAFIFFLVGGIKWILSQGDKKQVEEAQKTITYAIIGLVIVLLSFFIINFIGYLFGVKLI